MLPSALLHLVELGGPMIWPLAILGFVLIWILTFRTFELVSFALASLPKLPLLSSLPPMEAEIQWLRLHSLITQPSTLSQTLITAAPLLGLLGTVSGMITTFEALSEGLLSAGGGKSGIAEGIAQALVTTQMGLGIALPSLLWHRILERWSRVLGLHLQGYRPSAPTVSPSDQPTSA